MALDFDISTIEGFEWDLGNLAHIKKHSVTHTQCEEIFSNIPFRMHEDKTHSKLEERLQALGQTNNGRLLFIAFTIRNNKIRVISARDQSKKERTEFQEAGGEHV